MAKRASLFLGRGVRVKALHKTAKARFELTQNGETSEKTPKLHDFRRKLENSWHKMTGNAN